MQALHLMNAPDLHRKVTADDGRVGRGWRKSDKTPREIVEELYLLVYRPAADDEERQPSARRCSTTRAQSPRRRSKTCCGRC